MKIVLTGGGTAGHVTPNIALKDELINRDYEICYIGSHDGIEREIVGRENIEYYGISSGKLRRYMSFENFKDSFKVFKGLIDAYFIIRKIKPDIVFSKGGFVSCPVVWASKINKVPVVIHESDMSPGLANKLSSPFASKICCAFPSTLKYLDKYKDKVEITGIPVRENVLNGNRLKALSFTNLRGDKPVLLVMGGSLGSINVNRVIRENLDDLLVKWNIVHITGKGNLDESLSRNGYVQFEYINDNMGDLLELSNLIISRAGATAIFEIMACKKPAIFIPLPSSGSRGDQILNAHFIKNEGLGEMIEEGFTPGELIELIDKTYENRFMIATKQNRFLKRNSIDAIIDIIEDSALKSRR